MVETKLKIKDYVVIDIENPNTKADSICQIAIIQVKDDKVVYNKELLINPEDRFDDINMRVHKITPNMVKDEMTFKEYWEEIKEIVTNNIVVGHGIKFDISVISKALNKYDIELPSLKIICTQHLSQKYLNVDKYKLDSVCEYLNIECKNHHNASNDAYSCLKIFEYIKSGYGIDENDIEDYKYIANDKQSKGMKVTYSDSTKALQALKQIIEKIMVDKSITENEINDLKFWLDNNSQLIGNYPFDKINNIVNQVLNDGQITDEEFNNLNMVFNEFINPLNNTNDKTIIIESNCFCLTGTFNSGSKEDIEQKIIDKGGICSKGVSAKINYLIVGDGGSDAWKFGNYGGKVQKAMELKEKGKQIEIISEEEFLNHL